MNDNEILQRLELARPHLTDWDFEAVAVGDGSRIVIRQSVKAILEGRRCARLEVKCGLTFVVLVTAAMVARWILLTAPFFVVFLWYYPDTKDQDVLPSEQKVYLEIDVRDLYFATSTKEFAYPTSSCCERNG